MTEQEQGRTDFVSHVLPLRPGVKVFLSLPADLTPAEAERIKAFLQSVAIEEGS